MKSLKWMLPALIALLGCGSDRTDEASNGSVPAVDAVPSEAELARDAELANEAAADEAADMNNFGGSAAEMDVSNSR